MKRKVLFLFCIVLSVCYIGVYFLPITFAESISDSGVVEFFVGQIRTVTIYSPENITYNFDIGDPYLIDLNVSADFSVAENGWKYSLYDLRHSVYTEEDTLFTPNSSIGAVRWWNLLTVFAYEEDGQWWNATALFYVNVSNSPPILGDIDEPILVCEGQALSYNFNASDVDEDDLIGDISPKNPFYLNSLGKSGLNVSLFRIISGVLGKSQVKNYVETVSVVDPYSPPPDSFVANISVIEINNPPVMVGLGAQTVWLQGENSTFYHQMSVTDIEDGVTDDGKFSFNLTWGAGENLFDIDNITGIMNYSPVIGQEGKVYSLTVCVADNALSNIHENISLCSPRDGDIESVCDDFTLTVTDENRAPVIVNYTPVNTSFIVGGTTSSPFFVEVYDADGTIPDIDWYVDGVLREHNENVSNDSFSYTFGCGVSGAHYVEIITTDGLLSDSQRWNINVNIVACPLPGGGGGGGGGSISCWENWVCDDWDVCQRADRSFDAEILSLEDYISIKEKCAQNGYEDKRFCGFQITSCFDLNQCNYSVPANSKPPERRICYFTESPNCYDGITNCHDGSCELLVDCGGPCSPCATCSDGKQNQGESGVDCGGPCPFACEPEQPFNMVSNLLIVLSILLIILILYILYRVVKLYRENRRHKV